MLPGLDKDIVKTNSRLIAQLPRNLATNIAYILVSVIIGLVMVPYFIDNLGVAAYGIIPLATSISGYVVIVVQSLNTAISRFLTVDLQRKDYETANKTFNTAFFGLSAVILLMFPVVFIVAWFTPVIFNIPIGQESGVFFLFLGVFSFFLLQAWNGNFMVQLFAFNRLDLQNLVNTVTILVQTGLLILFFIIFGPNLALVGLAYLIGGFFASVLSIVLAHKVCPYLSISIHCFDRNRVKELWGMGWWVIINQIGALLFIQIDLIVVNLLFGATIEGQYAIALVFATLLRGIAQMLSNALTPTILTYYALKKTNTLIKVSKSSVKLMGLALALPIGVICGLSTQILTVWVGKEFTFLWPLIAVLTVHLSINLAVLPLVSINVAYNRVRIPGIVTLFMGISNLALALTLPLLTGLGYYGVAIAGLIVLTLKNTFFIPWYATKVLGISTNTFIRSMLPGIVVTILVGAAAGILGALIPFGAVVTFIVVSVVVTITYFVGVWSFGLNSFERGLFASYLPLPIRKRIT